MPRESTRPDLISDEILSYATALARKKGHARIGDAHVLVALCTRREVQVHLAVAGYCATRIDDHVRAALAAEPDERGYRGAPDPEIPTDLRDTLANVHARGVLRLFRRPNAIDLFDAMAVRAGLGAMRWDDSAIHRFHKETTQVARLRGHSNVLMDHALVALAARKADDGRFADTLVALGHDPELVRKAFRDRLTRRFIGLKLLPLPKLIEFASLRSNVAERRELGLDFVVVNILEQPRTVKAFATAGISRDEFLIAYAHRAVSPRA